MVAAATFSLLLLAGFSAANVLSGTPASIEDFPSVVQVEFGYGPVWFQYCVGSILTSRHVVSSAHCFTGPLFSASRRRIRAGATQRGRDGVIAYINSVHNHPSFDIKGLDGDITVVQLSSGLAFGPTMQQAPIVAPGTVFGPNVPVTLASWGRTAQDAIWADRDLNSLNLITIGSEQCAEIYSETLPISIPISENMLCSGINGESGRNLGIRDGGAPVNYDGILMGLVTFGSPVGNNFPLVLTSVAPYTNWIVETAV